MSGIYTEYTGSDRWAWKSNGRSDKGFFNYQRLLRSGVKTDIADAVAGWTSCAMDLQTVVTQLTNAYQVISGTWSGEAANDFYAEMARVQNYAMSLLLQVDSAMVGQGQGGQLIAALTAAGSGSSSATGTGGGYVTPNPAASGYTAMAGMTGAASPTTDQLTPAGGGAGGGDGMITGDMVSILSDAARMVALAADLANATLPDSNSYGVGDIAKTAWKLSLWMCGQVAHENLQDQLLFYAEVAGYAVAAALAPEVVAALPAILMIAETLNTPITEPVGELVLGTMTAKVMLDTLGWHSTHPDGSASPPVNNMNALGWGWVSMQKGLPGKIDPSRVGKGTGGTGPSGPGYPGPGSSTLPGGSSGPIAGPLHTSPVTTPKLTTPADTGPTGPSSPTTGTDPLNGADSGFKPYDPHGASLASYNPHSGLGGGSGLGGSGLGGLNPNDGRLASYDPRAGLGAGDGMNGGAGAGAGAGDGLGGGSPGGAAGAAGRAMPMSPGSGAGGKQDDKGRNRTAYLTEDEDVWGVGADTADGVL